METCPMCGGHLPAEDLHWFPESGWLTSDGHAIHLTRHESYLFDALWKARNKDTRIGRYELMDAMYAYDPNGGPENPTIVAVTACAINKKIASFGLHLRGHPDGGGYRLREVH